MVLVATLFPITLLVDRKFTFAALYAKEKLALGKIADTVPPKDEKQNNHDEQQNDDNIHHEEEEQHHDTAAPTPIATVLPLHKRIWHVFWDRMPSWRDHLWFALCGALVVVINQVLFAMGLYMTRSPFLSAVVQQVVPVYVCIFSICAKYEKVSWLKFFGIGCAVSGAVLTILMNNMTSFSSFNFDTQTLIGIACLLVNSFAYAIYLICQKRLLLRNIPPLTVTFWSFVYGAIGITCISFLFYKDFHPTQLSGGAWFGIAFGGTLGGSVPFAITTFASKHIGPTAVSIHSTYMPLISALFAYIFLHQTLSYFVIFGAILITIGVLIVVFARWRETKKEAEAALAAAPVVELQEKHLEHDGKSLLTGDEEKSHHQENDKHEEEHV